ncbi:MAG: orotate phosphoribosyltransferase [Kiritimatiellaeota bacterium]|nr:orotate phosphoribosyltransferase [Kiritimatiellota bacterium]
MEQQEVLQAFRDTQALLSGHFELRSGLHSDQFFQCALLLQYPRIAEKLCAAVVAKMRAQFGADFKVDAVISPALGGIPVGHEVGRAFGVRAIFAEKEQGKLVLRRAFQVKPGERFVVAEDVITRGGRVQEVVDIVTARGGVVAAIGVLVDRSGGTAKFEAPVVSLVQMTPKTWQPAECPLCKQGSKAIHPGS